MNSVLPRLIEPSNLGSKKLAARIRLKFASAMTANS